jgi:hypothetical protein
MIICILSVSSTAAVCGINGLRYMYGCRIKFDGIILLSQADYKLYELFKTDFSRNFLKIIENLL